MSLQEYFKSKEKLKESIVAATNQNFTVADEKRIKYEIAGASHGQNCKKYWVDISISNKNNDEILSTIYKYPFFMKISSYWLINSVCPIWKTWG